MDHLIKLIDVLIWPFTVLTLVYWGRKPLQKLIPFVESVKHRDTEIKFRQQLDQVKEDVGEKALAEDTDKGDMETLYKLVEISPQSAIIESWKKVEGAARRKIIQLVPEGREREQASRRPFDHLDYKGVLIPSTIRAVSTLHSGEISCTQI